MENIFSVAVQYKNYNGYIEYDAAAKKVQVVLDDEAVIHNVEEFFAEKHEVRIPHENLRDFTTETIEPLKDIPSFKLALTPLWATTGVHVDWSRPVEYVKAHPHLSDTKNYNEK